MLYKIFENGINVKSLHEPKPRMHSDMMIRKNKGDDSLAKKIFYNVKINMIMLENLFSNYDYYIE